MIFYNDFSIVYDDSSHGCYNPNKQSEEREREKKKSALALIKFNITKWSVVKKRHMARNQSVTRIILTKKWNEMKEERYLYTVHTAI